MKMFSYLSKHKKYFLAVAVVIAGLLVLYFYAWPAFRDRNESQPGDSGTAIDSESAPAGDESGETPTDAPPALEERGDPENSENPATGTEIDSTETLDASNQSTGANAYAHITGEHCNTGCQAFANKLDFFEYCEQVCDISPVKDVSNCDGKKDLQKDYCLKDLAIGKKDSLICGQISDTNVKKTCKNRILQDIIEGG